MRHTAKPRVLKPASSRLKPVPLTQRYGVGPALAGKLYRRYRSDAEASDDLVQFCRQP
jgi:hypothetical protein